MCSCCPSLSPSLLIELWDVEYVSAVLFCFILDIMLCCLWKNENKKIVDNKKKKKTQWTNTSRWHGTPNHHWLWKLYTGPQATWILCLSSLPPDSGTLISKGNAKFTFIREHNFGPLSSSPVIFVFSPGETLLTLSVVQEWLDTRNATAETHVLHTSVRSGSWSTDSSCSPLVVNLPHIFEWVLFHNPLQGAVIPIACTLFFYHIFSFPSPLY